VQAALDAQQQHLAALAPAIEALERVRQQLADLDERISRANTLLLRQNDLTGQITQRHDSLIAVREEQKRRITRLERQLQDLERWQRDLEHARQQQQAAESLTQQLATLRDTISTTTTRVGELRALCNQFNQRANDIKQRKALLDPSADDATCPLCQSDLGHAGITNILANYEQEITTLREQYRTAKRQADQEEASQKQMSRDADALEQQLTRAQRDAARIEPLEQQLTQAGEWQSEMEQAHTTLADVDQQLANEDYATEEREALLTVEAELLELGAKPISPSPPEKRGKTAKAPALEMLNRERKVLLQQQHSLEQQREQRTGIESELATLRHELEQIAAAAATLPATEERIATLSATIERGDFGHALRAEGRAIDARIAELGYSSDAYTAAREAVQNLTHWSDEQHRLNTARSRLENNRNTLQWAEELLERRAAEIAQLQGEETTLSEEVRALPAAEQHTRACDEAVSSHRRDIQVVQRDLYEKQTLQHKAEEAAQQLTEKHKERAALLERQSLFQELGEACGKKGVQAMLIETAIPEIEREANRLLGRITGNQMHLTFEMQRDTRKGDTVETLDIKIADAVGTRNYSAFSGGEAMRINFAIRVALSRLLAHRAGASLETLVIDEGFGALDADGRERFVEAITSVQHDFKRILVITHLQELKDRFPVHVEITRTTHGSVWALV
jgi:exonuclease SbcC